MAIGHARPRHRETRRPGHLAKKSGRHVETVVALPGLDIVLAVAVIVGRHREGAAAGGIVALRIDQKDGLHQRRFALDLGEELVHLARVADCRPIHPVDAIEGAGEDQARGLQRLLGLFRERVGGDDDIFARARGRRTVVEPRHRQKQEGGDQDRAEDQNFGGEAGAFDQLHYLRSPASSMPRLTGFPRRTLSLPFGSIGDPVFIASATSAAGKPPQATQSPAQARNASRGESRPPASPTPRPDRDRFLRGAAGSRYSGFGAIGSELVAVEIAAITGIRVGPEAARAHRTFIRAAHRESRFDERPPPRPGSAPRS